MWYENICATCVNRIPVHLQDIITLEKIKKNNITDCPICFESFNYCKNSACLSCTHKFHIGCITNWLLDHSTCPCCRSTVDLKRKENKDYEDEEYIYIDASTKKRQDRYDYLKSILDELNEDKKDDQENVITEKVLQFCEIYGEYNRAEFLQDTDKCDELYEMLIQFDSSYIRNTNTNECANR